MMIFGWIGLIILLFAYFISLTEYSYLFFKINIIATSFLIIHSIILKDVPFVITQSFIFLMILYKELKGETKW